MRKMDMVDVLYAEVGEAEGFVSGDALTLAHKRLTGHAVSAAPSVWSLVAAPAAHECTASCWALIIRLGPQEGCDEFAARDAADRELEAERELFAAWS